MNKNTKIFQNFFIFIFMSGALFNQNISSMDNAKIKKRITVYSHGFGENGSNKGPTYPDAPGQISKACFYTKPAVHVLANYLKDKVDAGYNAIDLKGRSCGAGTAINCLDKLIHYDENTKYFTGTKITSKADAQAIVNAINNGSLDFTVPFLSLKKANAVAAPSKYLGYASIVAACGLAYRWGFFDAALYMIGIDPTIIKNITTAVTTCAAVNYTLGSSAKNAWATVIDATVVPCITRFNYNPFHTKPIDAVKKLEGHIKCPTLIHCSKDDRVLENPDEDTIKFYSALRKDNENQTYIYLSEPGDGWHNLGSEKHKALRKVFKDKYEISKTQKRPNTNEDVLAQSKPSPMELRIQIKKRALDE